MKRKWFLVTLLCSIVGYYVIQNGLFSNNILAKPNVVIIVGDAMRSDLLPMFGGEAVTPNLDWLSSQGVVFENAYSNSPWTAPSAVSIFTGNYATTYNTKPFKQSVQLIVPDEEFLLSESLEKNGYDLKKNIENWNADINNVLQGLSELTVHEKSNNITPSKDLIKKITGWYEEGMNVKLFPVLEYLVTSKSSKPFFLVQWFIDPHAPYTPNRKFRERIVIDGEKLDDSIGYFPVPQEKGATAYSDFENRVNKSLYVAEIESVDERIGFIINALKYNGRLNNTIFIFTSDHGEEFGEHGHWGHGGFGKECSYYNPLMRVPLIMAGPGIPKGKRIGDPVSLIDIVPTINELLGGDLLGGVQGESLVPVMEGKRKSKGEIYFSNVVANQQIDALLIDQFKVIAMEDGSFRLYDILKDSSELHDISAIMPEKVKPMVDKLLAIRKKNEQRRLNKKTSSGFVPNSKTQEDEIVNQLKSLGYIK